MIPDIVLFLAAYFFRIVGYSLAFPFLAAIFCEHGLGLRQIALFYALSYFVRLILSFFVANIARRMHSKMPALGTFFSLVFLFILGVNPSLWPVLAFADALANSFYWTFHHAFFSQKMKNADMIKDFRMIAFLAAAVAPMIGAVLLSFAGRWFLLFFAIGFLFLSSALLFFTDFKVQLRSHTPCFDPAQTLAFAAWGVDKMWPVFVFIFSGSYIYLGLFMALPTVLRIIAPWFLKHLYGSRGFRDGFLLTVVHGFLRTFSLDPMAAFVLEVLSIPMMDIRDPSIDLFAYRRMTSIVDREFNLSLGFVLVMVLFAAFPSSWLFGLLSLTIGLAIYTLVRQ